uniref:C2H2-type domain-containing protein n=1 Tax=Megaselia scalaris TaxID=36166 RepID=T1GBW1_MEGSC
YCCNICPKKFTQVTSLNTHLQAHAGLVGYCCPQCPDKMFKQQSQLQSHMKSHGLSFPYECAKCDEKFLHLQHLDKHLKMHEEYKYKCDLCTSSFNQEESLKKHQQRHLDGRYVKCPVANCNEAFAIKQQLSKHLLSGHAHSELPISKRSKKNNIIHNNSLASTSSGPTTSSIQIISQQHIPITTTPGPSFI